MNVWDLFYLFGRTPWDSGITPPEIVSLVEGGRITGGRALDLGCGTGTNVIYLKQHGFDAVGVDISARAISKAREKIRAVKLNIPLYVADITAADRFPAQGPFDFVFDIGVMHIFDEAGRLRYAATVAGVSKSGTYHYTFGFKPGMTPRRSRMARLFGRRGPLGISADDVRKAMEPFGFELLEAHDAGIDSKGISRTGWYLSRMR